MQVERITRTLTNGGVKRTVETAQWVKNCKLHQLNTYRTNGQITYKEGIIQGHDSYKRYGITYSNGKPIPQSFMKTNIPNKQLDFLI